MKESQIGKTKLISIHSEVVCRLNDILMRVKSQTHVNLPEPETFVNRSLLQNKIKNVLRMILIVRT